MAKLDSYMEFKAGVLAEQRVILEDNPEAGLVPLNATSYCAGTTGVRPTTMGEFMVVSDSAPGLAGNSLGPSSPQMMLGALASCLVHTYLLQATLMGIPLDHVEVEVSGALDMVGVVGLPIDGPIQFQNLAYSGHIESPASDADQARLHDAVEAGCAVLNTLRNPMSVVRKDA